MLFVSFDFQKAIHHKINRFSRNYGFAGAINDIQLLIACMLIAWTAITGTWLNDHCRSLRPSSGRQHFKAVMGINLELFHIRTDRFPNKKCP
jgi:hypothetical protein